MFKKGRRTEETFSQRKHTDDQRVHEKVLKITSHQGGRNQNAILPHHSCQKGYYQKDKQ